jgi:mRNA interferase HicA
MKYSEFHKQIKKAGWSHVRTKGSHYIYQKDNLSVPVPFHGSKEIGEGLRKAIAKQMKL